MLSSGNELAGKITAVKNHRKNSQQDITKYQKLVGQVVDLASYEKNESKIKDRPVGVESANIIGEIIQGKLVKYTKNNAYQITCKAAKPS